MTKAILEKLVEDADLVADAGVRLGRIKNVQFLTVLSNARQALEKNAASPSLVEDLQKSLNIVINDISPIMLSDLRSGWKPFNAQPQRRFGNFVFGLFCLLLVVFTAYMTLLYDRTVSLHATTLELQDIRGAEQAIRLFGLLRKNQKDVIESLSGGSKDFLYEAFNKALFDLQMMNVKFQTYGGIASSVLHDVDIVERLKNMLLFIFKNGSSVSVENPTNNPRISEWLKNYNKDLPSVPPIPGNQQTPIPTIDFNNLDLQSLLNIYFKDIRTFTSIIRVDFDPLAPVDYSFYIYRLRHIMSALGLWVLPALYGMLGAVIFHMRRLIDPRVPNPSWLQFTYRILLGGFAGIILIWFWTPSPQKLSQPSFATLTSFGLAFLIGFSTDVFFQALDRFVTYVSQAVGKAGTQ